MPHNNLETLEDTFSKHKEDISSVIVEGIQGGNSLSKISFKIAFDNYATNMENIFLPTWFNVDMLEVVNFSLTITHGLELIFI